MALEDILENRNVPEDIKEEIRRNILERKIADDLIKQSEKKYRTLFETMTLGVVYQSSDGKIISANPAAERVLGLTLDQMQGRTSMDPLWRAIHEDGTDFPGDTHPAMVALSTGKEIHDVIMGVFNPKKNDYTWININAIPLFRNGEDKPFQTYATFEDITERKYAVENLRVKDIAIESAINAIAISDLEGKLSYVNPSFLKMWGYCSPGEVIGKSVEDFWQTGEKAKEIIEALHKTGGWIGELIAKSRHETFFNVQISANMVIDKSGRPLNMLASFVDISERKQMEDKLKESEERWRRAIASSPIPVMIHDEDDKVLQLSTGWTIYSGYTIEDIPTVTDWTERAYGERTGSKKDYIEQLFSIDQTVNNGEWIITAKDGSKRIWDFQTTPLGKMHEGKRVLHSIAIDMTDRKRAEESLRDSENLLKESQTIAGLGSYVLNISTGSWRSSEVLDKLFGIDEKFNRSVESWISLIHPDDRNMMSNYFIDEVVGLGHPFDKQYRIIRHNDQSERWVYGLGKLEFNNQGIPVKMYGTIQDITENKRVENTIASSMSLLKASLESTADGILVVDRDGKITRYNQKFADLWQLSKELLSAQDDNYVVSNILSQLQYPDQFIAKVNHLYSNPKESSFDQIEFLDGRVFERYSQPQMIGDDVVGRVWSFRDITERKQIEKSLIKSEEHFKLLFEEGSIAMALANESFNFVKVNKVFCRMMEYTENDLKSMTFKDITHPDHLEKDMSNMQKLIRNEIIAYQTEKKYVTKTRRVIWGSLQVSIIRSPDDKFINFLIYINDITERKQAEELLRESEEKYRTLIQKIQAAVIVHGSDTQVLTLNSVAQELLGLTEDQLFGKTINDPIWHFIFEDKTIIPLEKYPVNQVLTSKKALKNMVVGIHSHKKEKVAWALVNADPVFNKDNEIVQVIVTFIDITERKHIEDSLRLTQFAVENAADMIFWIAPDARIVEVNQAVCKLLGYTREDLLQCSVHDIDNTYNTEVWSQHFSELRKRNSITLETILKAKNGHLIDVEVTANYVRFNEKEFDYSFIRDITERKQIEEMRHRMETLESIGNLAGGIAHEFNNLFAGIFGFIDLAKIESNQEVVTNYLFKALNNMDRAKSLTQKLLTFAKGGSPVKKIQPLIPLIQEIIKTALSGSNIACEFNISESPSLCSFDESQIRQVLNNMILNAKESMSSGGYIEVSVKNTKLKEEGKEKTIQSESDYIKISIKDTGIGISKEVLPKIFDPFFSTKKMGGGLGLSICYSIIKRHDGWIEVESEPDKGSTFDIYLPSHIESSETIKNNQKVNIESNGSFLIMDDEEMILDMMSAMLTEMGYSVICANNGKGAIEAIFGDESKNIPFTAIILDLVIPGGIGGKEVVSAIRKSNKEIPVFVISGYSDDPVMKDPNKYGFNSSICMPFTRTELAELLNRYVKNKVE